MATFGSFSLLIALVLAAYNLVAGAAALMALGNGTQSSPGLPERLAETARRAGLAGFVAASAAYFALLWATLTDDFSLQYIVEHSNRSLPLAYKLAALWAGQEGSLLLWVWLLAIFGFVLRLRHQTDVKLYAYAGTILAAVQLFFLLLVNFVARPFVLTLGAVPEDGNGLNPLLQYWEMVIHPPLLYLGYVGFSVPFAFALGALIMRYPGEKWIRITRLWTIVSWLFLTCGIFLGMHWAYAVLGWGGYWSWDPVENASFLPWLTGTAFLHSVMMQEKRGMMKSWNVWLIFTTFFLTILGTALTRAGWVSSVHAFAASSIGNWFVAFLVLALAVCLFTYVLRLEHLKSERELESLASRESSFMFSNLVWMVATVVILGGTFAPVFSELFKGPKVTLDAAWYNAVAAPIGLFLIFLVGVGPLLPWRASSWRGLGKNFILPGVIALLTLILSFAFGLWPWAKAGYDRSIFYADVAFALAAGVITAQMSEFLRGARVVCKQEQRNWASAFYALVRRNPRRYGGYVIHLGVVLAVVGLAGAAFNQQTEGELALHDKLTVGPYSLECAGFTQDANQNYQTEYALLDVSRGGKLLYQMAPERRVYLASQQPQTMVAIHSNLLWDLYLVYAGTNPETDQPVIKAFLNPLVSWIWVGMLVIVLGVLVALSPKAALVAPANQPEGGR